MHVLTENKTSHWAMPAGKGEDTCMFVSDHKSMWMQLTADIAGSSSALAVSEQGIAWGSDVKYKFGSVPPENFNLEANAAHRGGNTITGKHPTICQHLYVVINYVIHQCSNGCALYALYNCLFQTIT